jgi:hypothetical protein
MSRRLRRTTRPHQGEAGAKAHPLYVGFAPATALPLRAMSASARTQRLSPRLHVVGLRSGMSAVHQSCARAAANSSLQLQRAVSPVGRPTSRADPVCTSRTTCRPKRSNASSALGFRLDQLHRNFLDLARCLGELAEPAGTPPQAELEPGETREGATSAPLNLGAALPLATRSSSCAALEPACRRRDLARNAA